MWLPNTSQALSLQCISRSADRILIHIHPHPFGLLSGVSLNLLSLFRTQGRSLALVIFAALSSTLILFLHLRWITMFGLYHSWLWGAVLCTIGCSRHARIPCENQKCFQTLPNALEQEGVTIGPGSEPQVLYWEFAYFSSALHTHLRIFVFWVMKHQLLRLMCFVPLWLICKMDVGNTFSYRAHESKYRWNPWQCRTRAWTINTRVGCLGCFTYCISEKKIAVCLKGKVIEQERQRKRDREKSCSLPKWP